jgi:predicted ABC-type ATPase
MKGSKQTVVFKELTETRDGFFGLLFGLVEAEALEDGRRSDDPRRPIVCCARKVEELSRRRTGQRSQVPSESKLSHPKEKRELTPSRGT